MSSNHGYAYSVKFTSKNTRIRMVAAFIWKRLLLVVTIWLCTKLQFVSEMIESTSDQEVAAVS